VKCKQHASITTYYTELKKYQHSNKNLTRTRLYNGEKYSTTTAGDTQSRHSTALLFTTKPNYQKMLTAKQASCAVTVDKCPQITPEK